MTAEAESEHRWEVGREHRGRSLYEALDALVGPIDRKALAGALRQGLVRLNGVPGALGTTMRVGDEITLHLPVEGLRRRHAATLPILYESETLIVADKPSGMPFDTPRGGLGGSALSALSEHLGPGRRARAAHRLDKLTSGLVVAGIGAEPTRVLAEALQSGAAVLEYLVIVRGRLPDAQGQVDVPLRRRRRKDNRVEPDPDHGEAAFTAWSVVEALRGFSILHAVPRGGRSHQVRAHLAAIGHPALCDALYREDDRLMLSELKLDYRPKKGRPERPLLERAALHAQRFTWNDVDVVSPLPRDLEVVLSHLRRLRGAA